MTTYTFKNTETDEIIDHKMSYTVLDQFKLDNPHLERYFCAKDLPIMSDASRLCTPGLTGAHMAFENGVINRMKLSIPGNTMAGHRTKTPREW